MGQKVKTVFFSEGGQFAYQIIGNAVYINKLPKILHKYLTPGMGSKGKTIFSEGGHVAYQIKENEVYT